MPLPVQRNLGTLRSVLQARLGFGAAGASAGVNRTLLNDWLYQAQKELYYLGEWVTLRIYEDVTLGASQQTIDYPTNIDHNRIDRIAVDLNGVYEDLAEGITSSEWSNMDAPGPPSKVQRMDQIQFYPISDQIYTIRIWGIKKLPRFEQDADLPLIDDSMIMLHAVTHGKEHYRHPDARSYREDLNLLLGSLRGPTHNLQRVYSRGRSGDVEPRPRVV